MEIVNDIELEKTSSNTFDWKFDNNDVSEVTGYQALISAVTHTIFLKQNELTQIWYQNKGNNLINYVGLKNNELDAELVKSELESEIKEIEGVEDCNVELEFEITEIIVNKITINTSLGGVLEIGI